MLKNYFAAAIRSLFRDRAYAAINICGLALGFAAVILIGLYVRDELSYDRAYPHSDRIFRTFAEPRNGTSQPLALTRANIADAMELDFPEVEFATQLTAPHPGTLKQGDIEVLAVVGMADPDFFRMFPPKTVAGNVDAALERPGRTRRHPPHSATTLWPRRRRWRDRRVQPPADASYRRRHREPAVQHALQLRRARVGRTTRPFPPEFAHILRAASSRRGRTQAERPDGRLRPAT